METWGSHCFSVAGLGVRLRGEATTLAAFAQHYRPFLGGRASITVSATQTGATDHTLFETPTVVRNGRTLEVEAKGAFLLRLHRESRCGQIAFAPNRAGDESQSLSDSLHAAIKTLFSVLLISRRGLLVHGAGIASAGEGIIAVGESGSGKSTLCSSLPSEMILNDELVAITATARWDRFLVSSTPFARTGQPLRAARQVPLTQVFGLKKSTDASLEPLSTPEALSLLMRCVALPSNSCKLESSAFCIADRVVRSVKTRTIVLGLRGRQNARVLLET
jgi:hypothetical protein